VRVLWAPWRLTYVENADRDEGCIFCELPALTDPADRRAGLVLHTCEHAGVIMNRYPYANAHVMVAPRRHTADFAGLESASAAGLHEAVQLAVRALERVYAPHGFNIGMNLGRAGGAGIPGHLHWHVVPRWEGDTNFMPVLADVRVMPQHIEEAYDQLLPVFTELAR